MIETWPLLKTLTRFALVIAATTVVARELPSEATLPGQVTANRKTPPKDLPPESALPGQTVEQPIARKLPGESALPVSMLTQVESKRVLTDEESLLDPDAGTTPPEDAPGAGAPGVPPIGAQLPGLPWLRLNMNGHTGTVRALSFTRDGQRLCSAGEDKALEVWTRVVDGRAKPRWMHERTIRWQVQRGSRGRIHALAAGRSMIALAGEGAMGGLGEILLVDPATGELRRALVDGERGHRQSVVSMSFGASSRMLASQDISGRALLWRENADTGLWAPRELAASDRQRYGEGAAQELATMRRFAPIAIASDKYVVLPVYKGPSKTTTKSRPVATWQLERIDTQSLKRVTLEGPEHRGLVTALAASPDGTLLASADAHGRLFFWDLDRATQISGKELDIAITALSFSQDSQQLAAGSTTSVKRSGSAAIQLWSVADRKRPHLVGELNVPQSVYAVALSPNRDWLAYTQASGVLVKRTAQLKTASESLQARARPVLRVAFAAQEPFYRVAIGTRINASGAVPFERSFDLAGVRLEAAPQIREQDFISPDAARGRWSVRTVRTATGSAVYLYHGAQQAARLPLRAELHGRPTAEYWISDRDGNPYAVAVGTSQQNNIYVFRLAAEGQAKVLRQFRGHEGAVRSISMSGDRRYLVSGAEDATIRVWNLDGFDLDQELTNRWGAEFQTLNGELVVTAIREDGPLYFRGMRLGDIVQSIQWPSAGQVRQANEPKAMLQALSTVTPDSQVVFDYRRRDLGQPMFQMLPAWQQLVTLFVAENREWAFWTPAGYYDASFDGHRLFGWQVNRGVELLPDFFLAAQFQQALERPQVMARLLGEGSLEAAFRAAQVAPPADAQNAVMDQYRLKPRVQILTPRPNANIASGATTVQAAIAVRDGLQLAPPKAFANGVAATGRRLLSEKAIPGGREYTYEWNAALPADPRVVIQVIASTEAAAVDAQSVVVQHTSKAAKRPARLYIVAAGVNDYRDAQIQRLDYAVSNARSLVQLLRGHSQDLYSSEATMLLDDQATRPLWSVVSQASAERLREEAQPDDLLLFFLSGHGVRDEETQRYYFVTANARFDDVKARRFSDCFSFEDFAAFADVPCRKLIVLDTCHSGAIQQPLRQQDLKAALRALQSDVVFTMTASEGSQEAVESSGKRLGRFTARLLEALGGAADGTAQGGDADGVVTLNEAFRYVAAAVAADSSSDGLVQHPTAGPIDLLEYAVVPLTRSGS